MTWLSVLHPVNCLHVAHTEQAHMRRSALQLTDLFALCNRVPYIVFILIPLCLIHESWPRHFGLLALTVLAQPSSPICSITFDRIFFKSRRSNHIFMCVFVSVFFCTTDVSPLA